MASKQSLIGCDVNYIHSTFHNITLNSDVNEFRSRYNESYADLKVWLKNLDSRRTKMLKIAGVNSKEFLTIAEQFLDPGSFQQQLFIGKKALDNIKNTIYRKENYATYDKEVNKDTGTITVTLKDNDTDPYHVIENLEFTQKNFDAYWQALDKVARIAKAIVKTGKPGVYYNNAQTFLNNYSKLAPALKKYHEKPKEELFQITTGKVVIDGTILKLYNLDKKIHKALAISAGVLFEQGEGINNTITIGTGASLTRAATGFDFFDSTSNKDVHDRSTEDIRVIIRNGNKEMTSGVSVKNIRSDSMLPSDTVQGGSSQNLDYIYKGQGSLDTAVCENGSLTMAFINYYTLGHLGLVVDGTESEKRNAQLGAYYILYSWVIKRLLEHMENIDLILYNGHLFWYYDFLVGEKGKFKGYLNLLPEDGGVQLIDAPYIDPRFFTKLNELIWGYVKAETKNRIYNRKIRFARKRVVEAHNDRVDRNDTTKNESKEKYKKRGKRWHDNNQQSFKIDYLGYVTGAKKTPSGAQMDAAVKSIKELSLRHAIWQHGNITSLKR